VAKARYAHYEWSNLQVLQKSALGIYYSISRQQSRTLGKAKTPCVVALRWSSVQVRSWPNFSRMQLPQGGGSFAIVNGRLVVETTPSVTANISDH
jgi:hypothetical protein